ncbi:MAG: hypothetical protein Ct9H300mP3_05080 [Gammaproteobacteria bacterium]|nr:MAG: hypothetical protein Ct9H300mP3_05080 [Gammaproteobacteria bacterium]
MAALGALGFVFISSMSMDIVEQVEKNTDRREEGLLGTINAFIHKLVGAGGVLLLDLLLAIQDLIIQMYWKLKSMEETLLTILL